MGEDERLCLMLEANVCQADEFRCRNGLCIPISFSFDNIYDCLDRSDELVDDRRATAVNSPTHADFPDCLKNPSILCEEYSCQYFERSCDNFKCLPRTDMHPLLSECLLEKNQRHWLEAFTYDETMDSRCWNGFICYLKLDSMNFKYKQNRTCMEFCNPRPSGVRRTDDVSSRSGNYEHKCRVWLRATCPKKLFVFPKQLPDIPFPPNVRFIYNGSDPNFGETLLPLHVCYETKWCRGNPKEANISCRTISQLGISLFPRPSYWQFCDVVKQFFAKQCRAPSILPQLDIDVQNLYRCNLSNRLISRYRLQDNEYDCFYQDDESFSYRRSCSFNLTDRLKCEKGCFPKRLISVLATENLCSDKESFLINQCSSSTDKYKFDCQWLRDGSMTEINQRLSYAYNFWHMCDGFAYYPNASDEYHCELWKQTCNRHKEQCNGYWNCFDGSDEEDCDHEHQILNSINHRYCFTPAGLTYLPINRVGDGQIDCLGATDERDAHCLLKYPTERDRRFRCANSSECVRIPNVCDGYPHCPAGDDELPCPWRAKLIGQENCENGTFACQDSSSCKLHGDCRCKTDLDARFTCRNQEHLWFCDLIDLHPNYQTVSLDTFAQFPAYRRIHASSSSITSPISVDMVINPEIEQTSKVNCRRGLPVGANLCFCPPSYYGEYCQYQSDRISIDVAFQFPRVTNDENDRADFYRAVVSLLDGRNETVDREELILHRLVSQHKHLFYLVYSDPYVERRFYSVVFDLYWISLDSVQFAFRQTRNVPFGFLPVNRLALIIDLPDKFPASRDRSIVIPRDICALGRYGNDCAYRHNPCVRNDECQNNGSCYPFDIRLSKLNLICLCSSSYFGDRCQYRSAYIQIHVSQSVQKQLAPSIDVDHIPLVVVYFADIDASRLVIREHLIYSNVRFDSSFVAVYYRQYFLSDLMFAHVSYDAYHSDYFLIGLHKRTVEHEQTSILASYRCPHVSEILFSNSDNLTEKFAYSDRIKFYHLLCYQIGLQCFYDEYSMCMCDHQGRFQCFELDHTVGSCASTRWFCLNDGLCRYSSLTSPELPFACACPKCYYGDLCQFTTLQYTVSLDVLKLNRIHVIVMSVLLIVGTVANLLSTNVFLQPKPSTFGCCLYLRTLSIAGQLGVVGFYFKFFYIYLEGENHLVLCVGLELLLSILPSIFDWLTACVALERSITCAQGVSFNRKLSKRIAKWTIPSVIVLNLIPHIHESFYRRLVVNPRFNEQSWCVIEYPKHQRWLTSLRKGINIFHIVVPFLINVVSTLALLVLTLGRKQMVQKTMQPITKKKPKSPFLREIFRIKHCFISPCLLFLFGLPRVIFVFAYSCIEHTWQEQFYLISYLVSMLPMVSTLFIFILPSTNYCTELKTLRLVRLLKRAGRAE